LLQGKVSTIHNNFSAVLCFAYSLWASGAVARMNYSEKLFVVILFSGNREITEHPQRTIVEPIDDLRFTVTQLESITDQWVFVKAPHGERYMVGAWRLKCECLSLYPLSHIEVSPFPAVHALHRDHWVLEL
jgi:hypothetical protein